jgi:hypothetical protein
VKGPLSLGPECLYSLGISIWWLNYHFSSANSRMLLTDWIVVSIFSLDVQHPVFQSCCKICLLLRSSRKHPVYVIRPFALIFLYLFHQSFSFWCFISIPLTLSLRGNWHVSILLSPFHYAPPFSIAGFATTFIILNCSSVLMFFPQYLSIYQFNLSYFERNVMDHLSCGIFLADQWNIKRNLISTRISNGMTVKYS